MADYLTAIAALRAALVSGFTALPLFWPNDPRDPSAAGGLNGFVYSEINLTAEHPVTLGFDGERRHRDLGELVATVYVPVGTLAGAAEGHASTIRALFGANSISGVQITSRRIGRGERVAGGLGHWYAVPVIVEWFSDRTE